GVAPDTWGCALHAVLSCLHRVKRHCPWSAGCLTQYSTSSMLPQAPEQFWLPAQRQNLPGRTGGAAGAAASLVSLGCVLLNSWGLAPLTRQHGLTTPPSWLVPSTVL